MCCFRIWYELTCIITLFLFLKTASAQAQESSLIIPPAASQVNWPFLYTGIFYNVSFPASPFAITYNWSVTEQNLGRTLVTHFDSTQCENYLASLYELFALCHAESIAIGAQPYLSQGYAMSLIATTADGYYFSFSTLINPVYCEVNHNRTFSTLVSLSSDPNLCTYGGSCTAIYFCHPGYTTSTGANLYSATCSSSATLEPAEACILFGSSLSSSVSANKMVIWSIALAFNARSTFL